MNQLIAMTNEMTMSTKEISDLTGKRHDNVMADARKMLGEIGSPEISGGYLDKQDRTQPCLMLNKDETMCLVAGYSTELSVEGLMLTQDQFDSIPEYEG